MSRKHTITARIWNAFCSKTPRNMQQNASQYAAKHSAICSKTQCKVVQNARLNAAKHSRKSKKWCF